MSPIGSHSSLSDSDDEVGLDTTVIVTEEAREGWSRLIFAGKYPEKDKKEEEGLADFRQFSTSSAQCRTACV